MYKFFVEPSFSSCCRIPDPFSIVLFPTSFGIIGIGCKFLVMCSTTLASTCSFLLYLCLPHIAPFFASRFHMCELMCCAMSQHTDLVASGSCDGFVRLWKCGPNHSSLTEISQIPVKGFVNALAFSSSGSFLLAAVGQEHRLGRWTRLGDARNGLVKLPLCLGQEGLL